MPADDNEILTVAELLEILRKMPQDALVVYDFGSEPTFMYRDQVTLEDGPDENGAGLVLHHGNPMRIPQWAVKIKPEGSTWLKAVHFPGN